MKKFNDRMLLESLVRKYGKNGVKNAINKLNENNKNLNDNTLLTYNNQLDFKEYFIKRSKQEGYKFNKDIFYFDDIDCVDGKTSRNIPGVKANKMLNFDEAYNRLLKYFLNSLQEQVNESVNESFNQSNRDILENIYDVLADNSQYITSTNFANMFPDMEIDYDDEVISLGNGKYLLLRDSF